MKDYYKILGVEKSASKDEIKKAFRKLAHEHHPDKTKGDASSAQKFKEASEAYSILSDDAKRKQYDTFGSAGPGGAGFNGQGGFAGFNAENFGGFDFSQFTQGGNGGVEFDFGDIFGDLFGGGRGRQARQERGRDISVDINLTFEESIFGVEKDLSITKASSCISCNGSGAEKGSAMENCKNCHGKGTIQETKRSFIGVFNTTRICDICHGKGQVPKQKCQTCKGEGVTERRQEISVNIPAGIENGQMVRLTGMGEAIPHGIPGDLYIKAHIKAHPHIRKQGHELGSDLKIKLTTAITGSEIPFMTLDGETTLRIPAGTNTGDVLSIKGKGVPYGHNKRGDFKVVITVDIPKKVSKGAAQLIDKLKEEGL